mmetsp:Transcript_32902/g.72660  ORF Transcript_32902/g.72660 Transcript_32902/m.72660 type:complete len:213 (-) Transcript_32902:54-692(-)
MITLRARAAGCLSIRGKCMHKVVHDRLATSHCPRSDNIYGSKSAPRHLLRASLKDGTVSPGEYAQLSANLRDFVSRLPKPSEDSAAHHLYTTLQSRCTPDDVQSWVSSCAAATGTTEALLADMLSKQVHLLSFKPQEVQQRAADLAEVLMIQDVSRAMELLASRPGLLLQDREIVERRLAALATAFSLTRDQAVAMAKTDLVWLYSDHFPLS